MEEEEPHADDGRQPKRRRSSRRKAAESAAKIAETARREADIGSDEDDDGGLQLRQSTFTEADVPKVKKRLDELPRVIRMENPPHDLLVRPIFQYASASRRHFGCHAQWFLWAQTLQQLLDQLEERASNFVGVRSALLSLSQQTSVTGSAKHDFKLHACPDLLRPLIELMAEWLQRARVPLTYIDDAQHSEMARRTVAATQIVRNLSIKQQNTELLANYDYLIPTLAALANDLPKPDGGHDLYLQTKPTRDDTPLTFVGSPSHYLREPRQRGQRSTAHPVLENILATFENLAPALALDEGGSVHTCLPAIVQGLRSDHKIITWHSSAALVYLSMPPANFPLLETALPDILDRYAQLLDEASMKHIDIRCTVIQALRNLSFGTLDMRTRITREPHLLAHVVGAIEHAAPQPAPRGFHWARELADAGMELLGNLADVSDCLPSLKRFEDRMLALACSHERLADSAEKIIDALRA